MSMMSSSSDLLSSKKNINIVDRPLSLTKKEVSLSAFAFLFSEIVKYAHHSEKRVKDVEQRLADMGSAIGFRLLEYISWREKLTKREIKAVRILFFIAKTFWKALFDYEATLEKINDRQYMISENESLITKFISSPKSYPNANAFLAGIVEGTLQAAEFNAKVTTPNVNRPEHPNTKSILLIDFSEDVIERES